MNVNNRKYSVVIFSLLSLFIIPLFFHTSEYPYFYNYSIGYFIFLSATTLFATLISFLIPYLNERSIDQDIFYKSILLYITLLCLFTFGEIILRFISPDPFSRYKIWGHKKSSWVGFEAAPNNTWSFTITGIEPDAIYNTDIDGFRLNIDSPEWRKNPGVKKIFIIGGSSVFGYVLNDTETWPKILQDELRNNHDYYVINAGTNGHDSGQILIRTYQKILPYKPDCIIYYGSINDEAKYKKDYRTYTPISDDVLFYNKLSDYYRSEYKNKNIYHRSLLFIYANNVYKNLVNKIRSIVRTGFQNNIQVETTNNALINNPSLEIIQYNCDNYFIRNIATIYDMCKRNGTTFIPCTFILDDKKIAKRYTETVKYYNQSLRNFCEKENINIIDIENDFSDIPNKDSYFYYDFYHPNISGAKYIAEHIHKSLMQILNQN